jgi:lipopolysaccharide export system protein LptA
MRTPSVKITRRALIAVIILVSLAVLFNYLQIWLNRKSVVKKNPPILSPELARSAEGFQYFDYKGPVLRFKIVAKRLLETRMGKKLLEGIEACDFAPDRSIRNEIRSQNAEFDSDRKLAYFSGNVLLLLDKRVTVQTNSLHYDLNTGTGMIPDRVQIKSREVNGSARGLRFDEKNKSLDFSGEVSFFLNRAGETPGAPGNFEKLHATSESAHYSELTNRIIFQGKARVESDSRVLAAEIIEGILGPDQKRITSLISTGNASYQSEEEGEARALSGDRIIFQMGASAILEKISVAGQAAFSSISPSEERSLSAGEIDLEFGGAQGALTGIQSRGSVLFRTKRGMEQARIYGDSLYAEFTPENKVLSRIRVQKKAKLLLENAKDLSGSELQAEEINMLFSKEGEFLESANASGNVVISQRSDSQSGIPQMRRMNSDSARFSFFPNNNRLLKDMNADGHVQITYEKKSSSGKISVMRAASDKIEAAFELKNNSSVVKSMTQKGNFSYLDDLMSATAGRCDYDAGKELLVLKESPRISNKTGTTTGEWMEYDQDRKMISVHRGVRSRLNTKEGEDTFFGSSTASSPILITADEMQSWTEKEHFRYMGKVQLLSEDQQLQAQKLEIFDGGERMEAQGEIRHIVSGKKAFVSSLQSRSKEPQNSKSSSATIKSSNLEYLKKSNELIYLENVRLFSQEMNMSSHGLNVFFAGDGKKVTRAVAHQNILIRRNGTECRGDSADWNLDAGTIVVDGTPAKLFDPERGRSAAHRLTWFTADDTILFGNR